MLASFLLERVEIKQTNFDSQYNNLKNQLTVSSKVTINYIVTR